MQPFRSPAKVQLLCDGDEIAKPAKLHDDLPGRDGCPGRIQAVRPLVCPASVNWKFMGAGVHVFLLAATRGL
jgi:hypothetical protein